jgi:hypothetical protein
MAEQVHGSGSAGSGAREGETEHTQVGPEHQLMALHSVRAELARLEKVICQGHSPVSTAAHAIATASERATVPAWLRVTKGEARLPVALAILAAVVLQLVLPDRLALKPVWLLPSLELLLLAVLVAVNPVRITHERRWLRFTSLSLIGLITLANSWSAVLLISSLVRAKAGEEPGPLLASGGAIWLTNVIAFALWYWEFDRGGPVARAKALRRLPDFQFVQMDNPALAHQDWEPVFADYFYLSFTNATAFSPTDVMPLSRWAKMLMLVQSAVSLVTFAVVISRAVSLFK